MFSQISLALYSFLFGLPLVYILKDLSEKFNFAQDTCDGGVLKIHNKKTSLLGGAAFLLSFLFMSSFVFYQENFLEFLAVLVGILIIFVFGFFDDVKWKGDEKYQKIKLVFLVLCSLAPAIFLHFAGISFNFIPATIISLILSFIYIFGAINSINYQDGMDGLAAGLVFISLIGFVILGFLLHSGFVVSISLILIGAVLAFLVFNFPPAKIFMGDSGAYSLGFVLAVLAMIFCKPYHIFSVIGPLFIIGIPFFDGIYTNFRKIIKKKSLLAGDREFYYDKLLKKYSARKVLAISYFAQAVLVAVGVLLCKLTW